MHFSILSSADWVMLDDASKLLAVVCMLIASKHDGDIPASCSPAYFKRIAYLDNLPNFNPLIESGFLIETLACASESMHLQANDTTETETETETESEKEKKDILRIEGDARHGNGSLKTQQVDKAVKETFDKDFLEFYGLYPRKVGKKAAEKAYAKARKDVAAEVILIGLKRCIPSWRDPQFTPHPATWLNRGGWDDQPKRDNFYMSADELDEFIHG